MSVIFNGTFSSDKPIYYPSNWESGKTAQEQMAQFKTTLTFWIIRNALECALSILWVFVLYILVVAAKQLRRLYRLPENNIERLQNSLYLESNFLIGIGCLFVVIVTIGVIIFSEDWGALVLMKGFVGFAVIYLGKILSFKLRQRKIREFGQSATENNRGSQGVSSRQLICNDQSME